MSPLTESERTALEENIKSRADDQMFRDYPDLGHEGTAVFYGTLSQEPDYRLDEAVIRMARKKAGELFEREE